METRNARRGHTQTKNIQSENIEGNIPELVSGSSTHAVAKQPLSQPAWKMPKRVRQYTYFIARNGFTLIELLVVVLIIGVLAAVALPQYQKAVLKSQYMQLVVLQDAIYKAERVYQLEHGSYTAHVEDLAIQVPGTVTFDSVANKLYISGKGFSFSVSSSWVQGYLRNKGLSYVITFASGERQCRDYNFSGLNQQICLSLGGQKQSCTGCEYDKYVLP